MGIRIARFGHYAPNVIHKRTSHAHERARHFPLQTHYLDTASLHGHYSMTSVPSLTEEFDSSNGLGDQIFHPFPCSQAIRDPSYYSELMKTGDSSLGPLDENLLILLHLLNRIFLV